MTHHSDSNPLHSVLRTNLRCPSAMPGCLELVGSGAVLEAFAVANFDELADTVLLRRGLA